MGKYIATFVVLFLTSVKWTSGADLGKKIVLIIASSNFRDEEYQKPRELFEKAGAKITVASSSLNISKGTIRLEVKPDMLIEKVNVSEFDAIVFVGGAGSQEYWNNKTAHKIAQETIKQNKVLGAICIAPAILARAGVLKDKRATCFESAKNEIMECGGKYTGSPVEIDENIITANGPLAAETFAKDIIEAIK